MHRLLAYLLIILSLNGGCNFFKNPASSVKLDDIIQVTAENDSLLADGFSFTGILAKLPEEASGKTVTFSTDFGTFCRSDSSRNSASKVLTVKATNGTARVFLRSDLDVINAIVSAQVDSFTNFTVVRFIRAYPDDILLHADPAILSADSIYTSKIEATLTRSEGSVSKNTLVRFSAVRKGTSESFGRIPPSARTGEESKVMVTLTSKDLTGVAVVTAMVENTREGTRVERFIEVEFKL
jgi:hypothetical protein